MDFCMADVEPRPALAAQTRYRPVYNEASAMDEPRSKIRISTLAHFKTLSMKMLFLQACC